MMADIEERGSNGPPQRNGGSSSGSINRRNLLDKICELSFGGPLTSYGQTFHDELCAFLDELDGGTDDHLRHLITKVAIGNWFSRNGLPTRQSAFTFLLVYMRQKIDHAQLSEARKASYTQLLDFLLAHERARTGPASKPARIYHSTAGNVVLSIGKFVDDREAHYEDLLGYYLTYRMRFSGNRDLPVAQEVLRVYRSQRGLAFEHWYLRNGTTADRFEGSVLNTGNMLWFIGTTSQPPERVRVMNFRNTIGMNPTYSDFKWGILSADVPIPSSFDPAAGRILLVKIKEAIPNFHSYARDHVKHLPIDDSQIKDVEIVLRFIKNDVTSTSNPFSVNPATLPDGNKISDVVLRVDQVTLENGIPMLRARS